VTTHHAQIIEELDAKPIVIGHSFGGLIVQRLLGQNLAVAGVAIDPGPIKGVVYLPPSVLRVASIALRNPANRKRAVALTAKQFRYGFGNAVSESESDETAVCGRAGGSRTPSPHGRSEAWQTSGSSAH
jgi:non-heme chloroperoxidase